MGNEINLLLTSKNSYTMNEFHNTQALCYYSRCQVIGRSSHLSDFQYRFVLMSMRILLTKDAPESKLRIV